MSVRSVANSFPVFFWSASLNIFGSLVLGKKKCCRYVCQECGKEFGYYRALKRCQDRHKGNFPHPCTVCDKKFMDKVMQCHIADDHNHNYIGGPDPTHASPYRGETVRLPSVLHQNGQVGG